MFVKSSGMSRQKVSKSVTVFCEFNILEAFSKRETDTVQGVFSVKNRYHDHDGRPDETTFIFALIKAVFYFQIISRFKADRQELGITSSTGRIWA